MFLSTQEYGLVPLNPECYFLQYNTIQYFIQEKENKK